MLHPQRKQFGQRVADFQGVQLLSCSRSVTRRMRWAWGFGLRVSEALGGTFTLVVYMYVCVYKTTDTDFVHSCSHTDTLANMLDLATEMDVELKVV